MGDQLLADLWQSLGPWEPGVLAPRHFWVTATAAVPSLRMTGDETEPIAHDRIQVSGIRRKAALAAVVGTTWKVAVGWLVRRLYSPPAEDEPGPRHLQAQLRLPWLLAPQQAG